MYFNTFGYAVVALVLLLMAGLLSGFIRFEFTVSRGSDADDDDDDAAFKDADRARGEYLEKFTFKMAETKAHIVNYAELCRKQGPLALASVAQQSPYMEKDFKLLCDGISLIVDGTEPKDIERWFDNVAMSTSNYMEDVYVEMVKQGVLRICSGDNPKFVERVLDSFDLDRKII